MNIQRQTVGSHMDCFSLSDSFMSRASELRLSPRYWQVLASLREMQTAAQVAARQNLPVPVAHAVLLQLERRGLATRVQQSLPVELCLSGWRNASPTPSSGSGASTPQPSDRSEVPSPSMPSPQDLRLRLGDRSAAAGTVQKTPSVQGAALVSEPRSLAPQTVRLSFKSRSQNEGRSSVSVSLRAALHRTPAPEVRSVMLVDTTPAVDVRAVVDSGQSDDLSWRLSGLLDALREKGGGDSLVGQLMAYRLFLRIPTELLSENQIRSVSLIDPKLIVRDPRLREALAKAAKEVAGIDWPRQPFERALSV